MQVQEVLLERARDRRLHSDPSAPSVLCPHARGRNATQGGGKRTFPLALSPVNHTVTPFWERRLERSSAFTEPVPPHRIPISSRTLQRPQRPPHPAGLTSVESDVRGHFVIKSVRCGGQEKIRRRGRMGGGEDAVATMVCTPAYKYAPRT